MADVKTVRGVIGGAVVQTTEENAKRLGSTFEPESKTASKSSSKSSSK